MGIRDRPSLNWASDRPGRSWPPEVLRGFVTAVLLPVVVYVLTTVVGAQLD